MMIILVEKQQQRIHVVTVLCFMSLCFLCVTSNFRYSGSSIFVAAAAAGTYDNDGSKATTMSLAETVSSYQQHNELDATIASSYIRKKTSHDIVSPPSDKNYDKSKAVKVDIYEEALCIDCQHFVLHILIPTYEELGPSIMDLSLTSFGNARYVNVTNIREMEDLSSSAFVHKQQQILSAESKKQILVCQHGIAECDANAYNLCVADIYEYKVYRYLPFVGCLYERLPMGYNNDSVFDISIFASCAAKSALDWNTIRKCHANKHRVNQLQQNAYESTPKEHQYVPWIVINHKHYEMNDGENMETFKNEICTTFIQQGGKHPACGGMPSLID